MKDGDAKTERDDTRMRNAMRRPRNPDDVMRAMILMMAIVIGDQMAVVVEWSAVVVKVIERQIVRTIGMVIAEMVNVVVVTEMRWTERHIPTDVKKEVGLNLNATIMVELMRSTVHIAVEETDIKKKAETEAEQRKH